VVSLRWLFTPHKDGKGMGIERIQQDMYSYWDKQVTNDLNEDGSKKEEAVAAEIAAAQKIGMEVDQW
jgi:hypothetical protein